MTEFQEIVFGVLFFPICMLLVGLVAVLLMKIDSKVNRQ